MSITEIEQFFRGLSEIYVLGFLRLDLILHVLGGVIITFTMLKMRQGHLAIFIILTLFASAKETFDYLTSIPGHWTDYAIDFVVIYIPLGISLMFKDSKISLSRGRSDKKRSGADDW